MMKSSFVHRKNDANFEFWSGSPLPSTSPSSSANSNLVLNRNDALYEYDGLPISFESDVPRLSKSLSSHSEFRYCCQGRSRVNDKVTNQWCVILHEYEMLIIIESVLIFL